MASSDKPLSRDAIFRAVRGQVSGMLGRTLTECLYWSQYAQHAENGMPAVWKTGAQLGSELGCSPRTANEHLKKLKLMGFWKIEYKPRPGHPSKVTWLLFTHQSLKFLALARDLRDEQAKPAKRVHKHTVESHECALSSDTDADVQQSVFVTSKHCKTSEETSSGDAKKFLLTKEQKAIAGKNEPAQKNSKVSQEEVMVKAPTYAHANVDEQALANSIRDMLDERNLKQWEWVSKFTWRDVRELCQKLGKVGVTSSEERLDFVSQVLDNWEWLRPCMEYRYSSHDGNLHRPTPMALAAETVMLHSALVKKNAPPPKGGPTMTIFDQPF